MVSGVVIGSLNKRRGLIIDNDVREDEFTATAEVALNDMFGYSSALRGATQGKGKWGSLPWLINGRKLFHRRVQHGVQGMSFGCREAL